MTHFYRLLLSCAAALAAATTVAALAETLPAPAPSTHFADADNHDLVWKGYDLYQRSCIHCHGRRLEGDVLWQTRDQFFGRRAPPHDYSGHTWQHSDEELFHMTKFGRFSTTPPDATSYMPAYAPYFSDDEIVAVIAFIKAQWPLGLRVSQALLNPGFEGMPPSADTVDWKLPPKCLAAVQKAGSSLSFGFGINGKPVNEK